MVNSLVLQNFRLFESVSLRFESPTVFLCGSNGQGKTSLLEALFYLANLRSFRTSRTSEMVRLHAPSATVGASVSFRDWSRQLAVEIGETRKLVIDGKHVTRASEFAGSFNTVTFLPDDPEIITGRSQVRRKFLDMFISMLDHGYFTALQAYYNGIKNRNCLLRMKDSSNDVIRSYHPALAKYGSEIVQAREIHLRILSDFMRNIMAELKPELADIQLKIRTVHELSNPKIFEEKLERNLEKDRLNGYTTTGPHLDDFDFVADGKSLKLYGSRGQCRATSFALKEAEFDIVKNHSMSKDNTVVIVDDATGDLDKKTQETFYHKISEAKQVFCSFTEIPDNPLTQRSQIVHITAGRAV